MPIDALTNGIYTISYSYKSANQCLFTSDKILLINRIPALTLSRSGNLCTDGSVTLSANSQGQGLRFIWSFQTTNGDSILTTSVSSSLRVTKNGLYTMFYTNPQDCRSPVSSIAISDTFKSKVLPDKDPLTNCALVPLFLKAESNGFGQTYSWFYKRNQDANIVFQGNGNELEVKTSGYYSVQVIQGGCSYTTPFKLVKFSDSDSLFVPNVFTPNNDTFNDVFRVSSPNSPIQLKVVNRYGTEVFSGDGFVGWNGGESPAAVLFLVCIIFGV